MATRSRVAGVARRACLLPYGSNREFGWPQLVRALDERALQDLAAEFGGTRLYIPRAIRSSAALSRTIGFEMFQQVVSTFGGERIYIPKDWQFAVRKRDCRERVMILRGRKYSVTRIARILGCSERHVYKVIAQSRPAR